MLNQKYPKCPICCDKNCTENHCTTCKGRDKMVCRGCILKLSKLNEDINMFYECPYCKTKLQPAFFTNDNAAFAPSYILNTSYSKFK